MTSRAEAAPIGKKHILDQQLRIVRQRELMTKLERDGYPDVVAEARRFLAAMERALSEMEARYAAVQERRGRSR
jgi:hypothetical protein